MPCLRAGCCAGAPQVFITNGWLCDVVVVCAKTDPSAGAKGVSLFLVEAGMKGFTKGNKLNKMGMKAQVCICVHLFSLSVVGDPPP